MLGNRSGALSSDSSFGEILDLDLSPIPDLLIIEIFDLFRMKSYLG